jgi:probable F420-dependent oxidoreductase
MDLGVTIFATDRTAPPAAVAVAAEERGFTSFYVPEHTHLPVDPLGPLPAGATELDEGYRRTLDPFVALATAASVTSRIRLGTGVSLIAEHDPIVLAKQVATLDHLSGGRVVLGVGYGWNRAEAAHHGLDFGRRREVFDEHLDAMRALWRDDVAAFHGIHVDFDDSWSWPKPAGRPSVPVLFGAPAGPRLFDAIAARGDGWLPFGGAGVADALPRLRASFERAGRDPAEAQVIPFGTIPTAAKLDHFATLGITEVVLRLPAEPLDQVNRALDDLARFL